MELNWHSNGQNGNGSGNFVGKGATAGRLETRAPGSSRRSCGSATGALLARAMIAAAAADGHIDAVKRGRILDQLAFLDLTSAEKSLLFDDLMNPPTVQVIAEAVREAGERVAAEVYAASLRVTDESRAEGRVYLQNLAEVLALPPLLVRRIHETSGAMRAGDVCGPVPGQAA